MNTSLELFPVPGIPEIRKGDSLPEIIMQAVERHSISFQDKDILVVAQKIVSKAEGCVYRATDIEPTEFARKIAAYSFHAPEYVELILQSSKRIVRMANGIIIAQTKHGFILANAGVDSSNAGGKEMMVVLPEDPDTSAELLRHAIETTIGKRIAVIISDTFGRPWRVGHVNMAIGIAGIEPFIDYRGHKDNDGREMKATRIAVADELCSAAELVSGKTKRYPVVIVRNFQFTSGNGSAKQLVRDEEHDIFK